MSPVEPPGATYLSETSGRLRMVPVIDAFVPDAAAGQALGSASPVGTTVIARAAELPPKAHGLVRSRASPCFRAAAIPVCHSLPSLPA